MRLDEVFLRDAGRRASARLQAKTSALRAQRVPAAGRHRRTASLGCAKRRRVLRRRLSRCHLLAGARLLGERGLVLGFCARRSKPSLLSTRNVGQRTEALFLQR